LNKWLIVFFVALAPSIGLLLRGLVWGADSFAFWLTACGNYWYASNLSSALWFVELIKLIDCNFFLLVVVMFCFYFGALIGIKLFGDHILGKDKGFLLVLFTGSITPLFFVEALRFENQFFSFCLAFISLGLYLYSKNCYHKRLLLVFSGVIALISLQLWFASILIVYLIVLCSDLKSKYQYLLLVAGFCVGTILYWRYLLSSFTMILFQPMNLIGEEIPLIGLVFIIHIITFIKFVPKKYLPYTIILLLIGLVKVKYLFIATPLLLLGLIIKDEKIGIYFKKDKLPLIPIAIFCLIGLTLSAPFLYPTQNDIIEMQQAIQISNDLNLPLRNDWGDGWTFEWLGQTTKYKISNHADLNFEGTGFIAYTNKDLNHCEKVSSKTFIC